MPSPSAPEPKPEPREAPIITVVVLGAPDCGAPSLAAALQGCVHSDLARIVLGSAEHDIEPLLLTAPPTSAVLVLLMGLDLPAAATPRTDREACDTLLRRALATANRPFHVVYGQGQARIANALKAIKNVAPSALQASAVAAFDHKQPDRPVRLRNWDCEKCSDPACEHRLFTSLTGGRPPIT